MIIVLPQRFLKGHTEHTRNYALRAAPSLSRSCLAKPGFLDKKGTPQNFQHWDEAEWAAVVSVHTDCCLWEHSKLDDHELDEHKLHAPQPGIRLHLLLVSPDSGNSGNLCCWLPTFETHIQQLNFRIFCYYSLLVAQFKPT